MLRSGRGAYEFWPRQSVDYKRARGYSGKLERRFSMTPRQRCWRLMLDLGWWGREASGAWPSRVSDVIGCFGAISTCFDTFAHVLVTKPPAVRMGRRTLCPKSIASCFGLLWPRISWATSPRTLASFRNPTITITVGVRIKSGGGGEGGRSQNVPQHRGGRPIIAHTYILTYLPYLLTY